MVYFRKLVSNIFFSKLFSNKLHFKFPESTENWYDNEYHKFQFKIAELVYLGQKLTANEPGEEKIRSIMELPVPDNRKGVQQLLGLLNYVGKFIPNLSEMIALLKELLVKNVSWHWGSEQDVAFRKIKEVLMSKRCLAYMI